MKVIVIKSASSVRTPPACCTLEACGPCAWQKKLLTGEWAARYKRISSSAEDKGADGKDPDH